MNKEIINKFLKLTESDCTIYQDYDTIKVNYNLFDSRIEVEFYYDLNNNIIFKVYETKDGIEEKYKLTLSKNNNDSIKDILYNRCEELINLEVL